LIDADIILPLHYFADADCFFTPSLLFSLTPYAAFHMPLRLFSLLLLLMPVFHEIFIIFRHYDDFHVAGFFMPF